MANRPDPTAVGYKQAAMAYAAVHEDARAAAIQLLGIVGFDTPETRKMVDETILEGTRTPFVPSPFKVGSSAGCSTVGS